MIKRNTPISDIGRILPDTDRSGQGVVMCPAEIQAASDGSLFESQSAIPFGRRQALIVQLKPDVVAAGEGPSRPSIVTLFETCGPATIVRRVWAVIVNTVNRVCIRRSTAHVFKKGGEIIAPALTHRDASAAVILKPSRRAIRAAFLHVGPNAIFSAAGLTMRAMQERLSLSRETSTTLRPAFRDIWRIQNSFMSTNTPASPVKG